MCHIHYNEQHSGGTWVVLFVCGPLISVLGPLVGDGDDSTDHSHRPLPDSVKCAQQTPQVGSWRGTCIFWNLLRNCCEIFWGGGKKYRTMLIPRPDRIWWCTRNISAGGDALNRTAMKALKMSIIHVVAFVISWTPYAIMGTWSVSQK